MGVLLVSRLKDEYGYKYPCVKARGIIDGSAEEVMGMIVDSTRVSEYNRFVRYSVRYFVRYSVGALFGASFGTMFGISFALRAVRRATIR